MGSRDRPHREAKKKPKAKQGGQPKLQPLAESPMQAELIRKERKPRRVDEEPESDES